jgi:hypothetical protein
MDHVKENTLSKARVGGYAQYFKDDFIETPHNKEGNNRIFYLLQTATNGGGASHVIRRHMLTADGHTAWKALLAWYEGLVMSGEIAKTLRSKLWALRLRSKDDVNKHINDFNLYMDQLSELGREEREETLTDLFLDSVIDPKFEVTIANCRLRERISIHECFEAIQKYYNVISRDSIQGDGGGRYKIRRVNNNDKQQTKTRIDSSYRTYAEWQKLTPEQRSNILEAREKEKERHENKDNMEHERERETTKTDGTNHDKSGHRRGKKRTRRLTSTRDNDQQEGNKEQGEDDETL